MKQFLQRRLKVMELNIMKNWKKNVSGFWRVKESTKCTVKLAKDFNKAVYMEPDINDGESYTEELLQNAKLFRCSNCCNWSLTGEEVMIIRRSSIRSIKGWRSCCRRYQNFN